MTIIRTAGDFRMINPHMNGRRLKLRLRNHLVAAMPYLPGAGLVLAAVVWAWGWM